MHIISVNNKFENFFFIIIIIPWVLLDKANGLNSVFFFMLRVARTTNIHL